MVSGVALRSARLRAASPTRLDGAISGGPMLSDSGPLRASIGRSSDGTLEATSLRFRTCDRLCAGRRRTLRRERPPTEATLGRSSSPFSAARRTPTGKTNGMAMALRAARRGASYRGFMVRFRFKNCTQQFAALTVCRVEHGQGSYFSLAGGVLRGPAVPRSPPHAHAAVGGIVDLPPARVPQRRIRGQDSARALRARVRVHVALAQLVVGVEAHGLAPARRRWRGSRLQPAAFLFTPGSYPSPPHTNLNAALTSASLADRGMPRTE